MGVSMKSGVDGVIRVHGIPVELNVNLTCLWIVCVAGMTLGALFSALTSSSR